MSMTSTDSIATKLYSVSGGSSAQAVGSLLRVLFPDAQTALDSTYGNGRFWDGAQHVAVTGLDRNPSRARDVCGDFMALPFVDNSFDVAVFDPPYHTDAGKGKASVMSARFGAFDTVDDLRIAVESGTREAWRVARLGIIVKVQNYIHASRLVHMTRWVEDAVSSPLYDELHVRLPHKIVDPKWTRQLSVWRNHATFLVFRKDGPVHRTRLSSAGVTI